MALTRWESRARELPGRLLRRPPADVGFDRWMRIEERRQDDTLVVRAEIPGVDPDRDIEVSVSDGVLHLTARRQEHREETGKGGEVRSEFRYGELQRDVALPPGTDEDAIDASYHDGILEVHVPWPPAPPARQITRVPVQRA